ncbi:unnamed protein product [Gordionus sp. m RMFG-2023]
MGNLAEYRSKQGFYKGAGIWESSIQTKQLIWWKGLCTNQPLCQVAVRCLSIPPSSASSERVWSAFGKIHSKTRNRIKNERVEKLISIRHNMHLKDHTNTSSSGYRQKSSDSDLSISSDNDDISISSHEDIDAISLASQEF